MIVLDTNVISELMEDDPHENVLPWFRRQPVDHVWLTSITLAELLDGINRLPAGRRRTGLADRLRDILATSFQDRLLAFDEAAAMAYGDIVPRRFARGRPISIPDAQIAAIALAHGATLATRNAKDFDGTGIALVNPWEPPDTT